MKKILFLFIFGAGSVIGQQIKVSQKIKFADVTVNLDLNAQKIVQNEVNTILLPSKFLDAKLERMQLYLPLIETILNEEEVHEDFKYTPVTESSLMPESVSSSNAVGFWQIKGMTGQELGLRIDDQVDERQNIFSSTRAAALYLKRNNVLYKNWVSSLLSYYLGATGVSKLIPSDWQFNDEITVDNKVDRYLFKNLAQKIAFEDRINRLREPRFNLVEYKEGRGKTLAVIAKELNISEEDLKSYNTWLKVNQIPTDKDYSVAVVVPIEQFDELVTSMRKSEKKDELFKSDIGFPLLKKITVSSVNPDAPIFYEINEKKGVLANIGDTYETLATRAGIDPKEFLRLNDMQPNDMINGDEVYYLEKKDKRAKIPFHTVKEDQSLRQIANMYGVQLESLLKNNRMENVQRVQAGRVLWLRKRRPRNKQIEYIIEYQKPFSEPEVTAKPVVKSTERPPIMSSKKDKKTDEGWIEVPVEDNTTVTNTTTKPFPSGSTVNSVDPTNSTKTKPYTPAPTKPNTSSSWEQNPNETSNTPINPPTNSGAVYTPNYSNGGTNTHTPTNTTATTYSEPSTTIHSVDVGNTVYSISRKYNVSVKDLYTWNNLNPESRLYIGQQIIVQNLNGNQPKYESSKPTKAKSTEIMYSNHTVESGENLFRIGLKYGVTVDQIKSWNSLTDNSVKVGQRLKIRK